jgi:hypothetical protein
VVPTFPLSQLLGAHHHDHHHHRDAQIHSRHYPHHQYNVMEVTQGGIAVSAVIVYARKGIEVGPGDDTGGAVWCSGDAVVLMRWYR